MRLRPEASGDAAAIGAVIAAAFDGHPQSDGSETAIVARLRASGDLALSLVAEEEGRIVGHVALSPVTIGATPGAWFGLGPLSVHPAHQGRGIGSALIRAALDWARGQAAAGVVLVGAPKFYARHGFAAAEGLRYLDVAPKLVQYRAFASPAPSGEITYSPAFGGA